MSMRNFFANASATRHPTLCRVRSYSPPGLPSPTISFIAERRVQSFRMAELPQAVVDHLDEIRELCAQNHVLRLSYLDDPHARVPNFVGDFEPHPAALVRGQRFHAVWSGLFDIVGDNNRTTPAM